MKTKTTEITLIDEDDSVLKFREWPDDPDIVMICNEMGERFWFKKSDKGRLIDAINKICGEE